MMDETEEETLVINEEYARIYEQRKRKQELLKLQEKYGSDEESSSSEEEDEDASEVTAEKTVDFLRTLSLVKTRDPRIYDGNTKLYVSEHDDHTNDTKQRIPSTKPLYLRDLQRESLLKGTEVESDDEESLQHQTLTYDQEQQQLKQNLIEAAAMEPSSDEILSIRVKSEEEKKADETSYLEWLKGHEINLKLEHQNDMESLKKYWCDPELHSDEAFLRDYILNQMWMDKSLDRMPTYDEIVEESSASSNDEAALEEQDDFERQYNFRFEEPGSTKIVSYPRSIPSSVRKEDNRRKEKRKARQERKALEKKQKIEELKRLKNLKKKEIIDKLDQLRELTGNSCVGFTEEDIAGEFDPSSHDQKMNEVFDAQYYETQDDVSKPDINDSDDENWDDWVPEYDNNDGPHCEDPDFNMDADYNPDEEAVSSKSKRKKRSLFSKAVKRKKPTFEASKGTFDEYFDEYYNLDFEDIIGDIPCRFHYRPVVSNDFGLTTEEILACEDRELNRWVSLKKAVRYRTKKEEKKDVKKYQVKAQNHKKKLQILPSLKNVEDEEVKVEPVAKKPKSFKRKKQTSTLSDTRLSAYGLSKQMKHKN